jgi:hypothetical protein
MAISSNKTTATAIALFLMLTIAFTLVALPIANAHDPAWTIPTWCYVSVANSVIGVNQDELIVFWLNFVPPTSQGAYGDRWTFYVDVVTPDGSSETLGPFTSDPIGSTYTMYTPTQIGTYTVVSRFTEHTITGLPVNPAGGQDLSYVNDTYQASESNPVTFIVQQEAIQPWPEAPLPTQFWTRPINEANRNWAPLAGNWLAGAAQNVGPTIRFSYGTGPESAHVLWATPMWAGGIMDARFGDKGYETGHYEGTDFVPPIILNGKIYYNVMSLPREGWYCLDLYTGETLFFHNTTGPATGQSPSSSGSIPYESLAFGQILEFDCPNQHGGFPYLWSTSAPTPNTWMMFDAVTGNYICSINNVPSWAVSFFGMGGTTVYGKDGSITIYNIVGTGANKRLQVWNTTQAIWWRGTQQQYQAGDYSEFPSNSYWMWRPGLNVTYDGSHGYSLNASIPDVQGSIYAVREDQFVIGGTTGKNNGTYVLQGNLWALSLKAGEEGTLLWNRTFTPPEAPPDVAVGRYAGVGGFQVDPEDGVFLFSSKQTMQRWGYSLDTGKKLWGPTASEPALNFYSMDYDFFGTRSYIYQGMLLSVGYGGVLIAYNITTGEQVWNYTAQQVGFESPYGNYPINIAAIADGKIYTICGEHSITQPMWRGYLRCINATTGEEIWKILQFGADGAANLSGMYVVMADGFVVGLNQYDSRIYCYGKGPSATTVSASPKVSVHGDSVLIEGTVTDDSPSGSRNINGGLDVPLKGTPAIADEDQEAWMEYLFMDQAKPLNATGVEVVLETLDPNGNFYEIGRTTSDTSGNYGYAFEPPVPGMYQIIATFEGSASYYGSVATTYMDVSEAPAATPEPTPTPASIADMYFVPATIGIIIAIVAVGAVIVLMLRKR